MDRSYIAIDLKSFYASVECAERKLDPLTTNLVVADLSRTEKTICLAVSPSLKSFGIPGRPRLFEVVQRVRDINTARLYKAVKAGVALKGENGQDTLAAPSFDARALEEDPSLELGYIVAPPQMARYIEYSTRIFNIYTKYVSPEDIHVYSIDEVFIDVTYYLNTYHMTARELCMTMIREVLYTTGITATAGIGTNLYLAKVAMDIVAKRVPPDRDGVRIAELDELSYRQQLWAHEPLTDFWRVGRGYARSLEKHGMHTMGDVARCSLRDEALLYKLFGINAELLIDHAWGWEPCTIAAIKAYKPSVKSLSSGQVLHKPYTFEKARLVLREMAEALVLDLLEKGVETDQMAIYVGYDRESLSGQRGKTYKGPVTVDHYGRTVPKHANGSADLGHHTASSKAVVEAVLGLYDRVVDPSLLVRRLNVIANNVQPKGQSQEAETCEQLDLFADYAAQEAERVRREKEARIQSAVLSIQQRYGKNALLKAADLQEDATAMQRNSQIGGHKA